MYLIKKIYFQKNLIYKFDHIMKEKKVDLVVLVGGKGTRISKYLKNIPKPLYKFKHKNFLSLLLNFYLKYPFNNVYLLAGHKGKKIYYKFNNKSINFTKIKCIIENKQLGTGGALRKIKKLISERFLLVNGDSILFHDLNFIFNKKNIYKKNLILLTKRNNQESKKLVNLKINSNGKIFFSDEGKLMNAGIYHLQKKILFNIKKNTYSFENEILTKAIHHSKMFGIASKGFFIDIGTPRFLKIGKKILPNVLEKRSAFFDRDGVINYDTKYVHKMKDFKLKPHVLNTLKFLISKNFQIFIVTNQAGIAKKIFTLNEFISFNKELKYFFSKKGVNFDRIEFCPYHENAINIKYKKKTNLRKPGNGMIKNIFKDFYIKKNKSFAIGDQKTDEIAFKKSNIYFEFPKKNLLKQVKSIISKKL